LSGYGSSTETSPSASTPDVEGGPDVTSATAVHLVPASMSGRARCRHRRPCRRRLPRIPRRRGFLAVVDTAGAWEAVPSSEQLASTSSSGPFVSTLGSARRSRRPAASKSSARSTWA
jgi:hypothetical protein